MTEAQFNQLYKETRKIVKMVIRNKIGDYPVVDDLSQEVFIRIWNNGEEKRHITAGFAVIVARNVASHYYKRGLKIFSKTLPHKNAELIVDFQELIEREEGSVIGLGLQILDELVEEDRVNMEVKELVEHVAFTLDKLPPIMRKIVKMRYFEDKSNPEISQELGMTLNTVKTMMSQGLKRLDGAIQKSNPVYYK